MFVATTAEDRWELAASGPLAEGACVLALMEASRGTRAGLISLLREAGSARAVVERRARVRGRHAELARALVGRIGGDDLAVWVRVLAGTLDRSAGTSFVPVTDPRFPACLAELADSPPFLFVRGDLADHGEPAVAVVGSRVASPAARALSREVSGLLARTGSVVVSGLALGIDAEAHASCLDAGGVSIASLPSGVDRIYPSEHEALAGRIAVDGALVSRFWPDAPPRRDAFRLRNVVTSGISIATIVIEAGPTSGARMQARIALSQGRPVILMRSLVQHEPWARRAADRRGVLVAGSAYEVVEAVRHVARQPAPRQLALF
jgi:DNA processing protein